MNECEQLHPLLRGYLDDRLTARERRVVARHLNLCASARKELDQLRSGAPRTPVVASANPPSEPWDLKILRWFFKTPKPSSRKEPDAAPRKTRQAKPRDLQPSLKPKSFPLKAILGILLLFVALAFLTHFIQNAGENSVVKDVKRWLAKNHIMGVAPSLDLVLDLTNQPYWNGNSAPVASEHQELVSDPEKFRVYWSLLEPGLELPNVDFTKEALVVFLLGPKPDGGNEVRFKRMENYADKTILWYDEGAPTGAPAASSALASPWVIQVVPKPAQTPVLIQKIQ